jgi:hypothetical protein
VVVVDGGVGSVDDGVGVVVDLRCGLRCAVDCATAGKARAQVRRAITGIEYFFIITSYRSNDPNLVGAIVVSS